MILLQQVKVLQILLLNKQKEVPSLKRPQKLDQKSNFWGRYLWQNIL